MTHPAPPAARGTQHVAEQRRPARPRRPVDASMGLLNELMASPVEPGYAEAARRRRVGGPPERQVPTAVLSMVMAIALGIVTVTAVQSLRGPRSAVDESRVLLAEEITRRSADAEALAQANESLSAEIAALQSDALAADNPALFAALEQAELLSGAVAVRGPGLVVELADAQSTDGLLVDPTARVQDMDLQVVTNALWAAGAEAIAINGQRLTAVSAIRGAGQAILVDLAPLIGPYRVEAIGDVRTMQTAFARSPAAAHLSTLSGTFDIRVTITSAPELTLPGAGTTSLRHATVHGEGVASSLPSAPGDTGGDGADREGGP